MRRESSIATTAWRGRHGAVLISSSESIGSAATKIWFSTTANSRSVESIVTDRQCLAEPWVNSIWTSVSVSPSRASRADMEMSAVPGLRLQFGI